MNLRLIDWIWHIRGRLPLPSGQSSAEAFDRLEPLFQEKGTTHHRMGDTLTFSKKDQAAQDRMSIFDGGVLRVEPDGAGTVITYDLKSRALLACFLAPLVFLAFAQFSIALSMLHDGSGAADRTSERTADETSEEEDEETVIRLHPIDKFLGAPEPKQPDDEDEETAEAGERGREGGRDGEAEEEEEEMRHSPTTAYVFAGIFALVYIGGRILEHWLIRRLFRRRLYDEVIVATSE